MDSHAAALARGVVDPSPLASMSKEEAAGIRSIVKGQEKLHKNLRTNIQKCLQHEWCLVGIVPNEVGKCCQHVDL